ncbi:PREDICTED: crossover junction endonuclease MUS81 isoform X1 [Populus euphratica]|uniref:Crossover junction endonuclease MUS81 n=1 Tax=Populus euphratica TaxID=75702 RepID=A0AAJ6V5U6_POPEU|nr:PREDICTED: crossover junction endonuclease MUS81 isoform X1 [Populus euphratica]XP_011042135.1 PREDICTED: crossover junction endonuclease MUS81 isoform X1 [Populus euphratica]
MQNQKRVLCSENEDLVSYMLQKRQELVESPKGLSEKLDMTLSKAYSSVCCSANPIKTLKDLSQIKGVGKWIVRLMQGFFDNGSGSSEPEDLTKKGKRAQVAKRYLPQRNSVSYALLITLYRETVNSKEFMHKQELIDAAEVSGLSRAPIVPEKGKGKPSQFGSSSREWYSGWSCMTTLINKGLVVKSSCPAKYMLTEEGRETARECLIRSRMEDPGDNLANLEGASDLNMLNTSDMELARPDSARGATFTSIALSRQKKSIDVPLESLERFMRMGYSKEKVLLAFTEVSETSQYKEISSLWPAVLCHLREDLIYGVHSEPQTLTEDLQSTSTACKFSNGNKYTFLNAIISPVENVEKVSYPTLCKRPGQVDPATKSNQMGSNCDGQNMPNLASAFSTSRSFSMRACSSSEHAMKKSSLDRLDTNMNVLSLPPLSSGERFEDVYEVILILDDREQFAIQCSRGRKLIECICKEHKIKIQVRRLPVGDGIWIARHKYLLSEYVLDFIVERKKVDDLRSSIRDNRYRDQKLRLLRCGIKKLIYLVEGDPNSSEAAESIKTACFTTEILEGFDVQRTNSLRDTLKKYAHLTQSITQYYSLPLPEDQSKSTRVCPPFDEFIKRCQDLDKMTVSDVFAIQLMQVPQVTEETAVAVLNLYPTLLSLARAYSLLDGDVSAQEGMLRKQSSNAVSAVASRNIFQLVWGK